MEIFLESEAWLSLVMLTAMEIVLGIDNVIFLSILAARLPPAQQKLVRGFGLALALVGRLLLLFLVSWMLHLTRPLFSLLGRDVSGRDLILLAGGLFLVAKATHEIARRTEHTAQPQPVTDGRSTFAWILAQILVLDLVFSLDSVITAVGMAQEFDIMVAAMVIAVGVMLVSARGI
jgi:predicted tellurium resistance membrane protein TerC